MPPLNEVKVDPNRDVTMSASASANNSGNSNVIGVSTPVFPFIAEITSSDRKKFFSEFSMVILRSAVDQRVHGNMTAAECEKYVHELPSQDRVRAYELFCLKLFHEKHALEAEVTPSISQGQTLLEDQNIMSGGGGDSRRVEEAKRNAEEGFR